VTWHHLLELDLSLQKILELPISTANLGAKHFPSKIRNQNPIWKQAMQKTKTSLLLHPSLSCWVPLRPTGAMLCLGTRSRLDRKRYHLVIFGLTNPVYIGYEPGDIFGGTWSFLRTLRAGGTVPTDLILVDTGFRNRRAMKFSLSVFSKSNFYENF
jgi:hypothetical protein